MDLSSPLLHQTLADIVIADTRAADVFDRLGLDYCCHGHDTLEEAAAERRLAAGDVLRDLAALGPRDAADPQLNSSDLSDLTRHIVSRHHAYVREATPRITAWLNKLINRHGAGHPELEEVRTVFAALAEEMRAHMAKEENILFPFIDLLAEAARTGHQPPPGPFGTIMNPIRMMEADHREAGDGLTRLRQLTHGYQTPDDGCTTYRLCYEELARFEADLHRHVHLENNVLFPRAAALENELM
jgi:regulator of cell morphogenesis and NO signaling